jgi:hypothetical protein
MAEESTPFKEPEGVHCHAHSNPQLLISLICKSGFLDLSIVYISIKLQRFGSCIFIRLQVKKGRTETLAVGPPG